MLTTEAMIANIQDEKGGDLGWAAWEWECKQTGPRTARPRVSVART